MNNFVNDENIRLYRRLLLEPNVKNDPVRHAMLLRLLAECQAINAEPRLP
ncbi:MAG: hypothetical protein JWR73_2446 [Tardiphaga sp.]|jgi:hypothetical protein|nr:hypothetical protein [Tardiphaga sp.]